QVAFRQVHLKYRRKLVVPDPGLRSDWHRQRNEVLDGCVRQIGKDAFEVAVRFQNGNFTTEHVDREFHAPPRSRRSSSSEPDMPVFTNVTSMPSTASTARSFREPNSETCPRSKRRSDSGVIPACSATAFCFSRSSRLADATA